MNRYDLTRPLVMPLLRLAYSWKHRNDGPEEAITDVTCPSCGYVAISMVHDPKIAASIPADTNPLCPFDGSDMVLDQIDLVV